MQNEGPSLAALLHRLSECPAEFLAEPRHKNRGVIEVAAIVGDHFRDMGLAPADVMDLSQFQFDGKPAGANRLRLVAVATWLLNDASLKSRGELGPAMATLLSQGLNSLASVVRAEAAVADPDRREELVRLCLQSLNLRPQGESQTQAADRLTALDSVERSRVVRQTREAEARAREVREMMARRAAEEAAAKASRE
jgi:hypothetical protein